MTDHTPEESSAVQHDVLADARDAEDVADEALPLDPSGPTELGSAVDS